MMRRFSSSKRSALLAAEAGPAPFAGFMTFGDHEEEVEEAARRAVGSIVAASCEGGCVGEPVSTTGRVRLRVSCRRSARDGFVLSWLMW
jgi:hypothetical protein